MHKFIKKIISVSENGKGRASRIYLFVFLIEYTLTGRLNVLLITRWKGLMGCFLNEEKDVHACIIYRFFLKKCKKKHFFPHSFRVKK